MEFLYEKQPLLNEMNEFGEYHHLFRALRRHLIMSIDTFQYILSNVSDRLVKQRTNWRRPIGAEERLLMTIR